MDYFSKFLKTSSQPSSQIQVDRDHEFHKAWESIENTLLMPDERQLSKGIESTNVPALLKSMVDSLVWESARVEDGGTGACLEYLLKNDVLGTLVRLSETDRPFGIQAEVLRAVSNMVVLLDEQFLVHSVVHKAVLRLLRNCVGDDIQDQLDGRNKLMGAARNAVRSQPSEHEEDLVHLLCILCSRIRTYRDLLMIFFHDKHWYHSEPLFALEEEDETEEENEFEEEQDAGEEEDPDATVRMPINQNKPLPIPVPFPSTESAVENKKTEYEFLLFNYLLRFVHREGQIGDFARAGLLFLMDVAMSTGESDNRAEGSANSPVVDPVNDAALALAEYILDGDFSEVLGAGLVAVYAPLPSKLGFFPKVSQSDSDNVMTIGMVDVEEKEKTLRFAEKSRTMGVEDARSPEFKVKIDHFLTFLTFLQDVLRRNVSQDNVDASALVGTAIVRSILDSVRQIFFQNVLYPSILECSDADGSAVAVMSYIDIMIRTLRDGPLSHLLVNFLVSEDNDEPWFRQRAQSTVTLVNSNAPPVVSDEKRARHRRRQSSAMTLLEMEAPDSRKPSNYFTSMARFTLKDLLLSNLRSKVQATATSALQLFRTMLSYHPQLTIERVLLVIPDSLATAFPHPAILFHLPRDSNVSESPEDDEEEEFTYPGIEDTKESPVLFSANDLLFAQPETTFSTHEREMGLYLALVSRIDPSSNRDVGNFSTGYDHYLHDAIVTIQSQPAYINALENSDESTSRSKHRLNVNDPVLSRILESLTTFFFNSPDFNIGLTGVLATLAIHPDRSMAGWILFAVNEDPFAVKDSVGKHEADYEDVDDRSIDFAIEEKLSKDLNFLPAASMDQNSRPVVYSILLDLVNQLQRYRQSIEEFDKFLLERRQGLLFSENLSDALTLDMNDERRPVKAVEEVVQKPKSVAKASASSSFVSFLSPKKSKPAKLPQTNDSLAQPKKDSAKKMSAMPFGSHYQRTGSVKIDPFVASMPSSGPLALQQSENWVSHDEDVFAAGWAESGSAKGTISENLNPVTLSVLLDNVVILEESIKELAAIIHARRSLGIDSIRYL